MKKVMFISSVGGHLTEILKLEKLFKCYDYVLVTEKNFTSLKLKDKYNIEYLCYGSRYHFFKYIFVCIFNFFKSFYLFFKYNPDLIYTTGAHTSVLMCYLGKLFRKKIIFVEVYDRINIPTLSGRMVYPIATTFIVQHEELKQYYPKAKYVGSVY